ncbi:hypothetical protein ABT297_34010 [Dactylosporangium sp. NPDC000555]|uniref:hypothetical protein n=1 Tax=Dactylosporangium sp. NPDC000555 TaxID=3154260 RepID=UPI00332E3C63
MLPAPPVAVTPVGVPGGPGITGVDGALAADVPPGPVATTVNVYEVPAARPETVQPVVAVVHEAPPGDAVTV